MLQYAKCVKCDYIQPLKRGLDSYFYCSICDAKNFLQGRVLVLSKDGEYVATEVSREKVILEQWDTAIATLANEHAEYSNIRLRNCSLDYDDAEKAYRITYNGSVFKPDEIELMGSWEQEQNG